VCLISNWEKKRRGGVIPILVGKKKVFHFSSEKGEAKALSQTGGEGSREKRAAGKRYHTLGGKRLHYGKAVYKKEGK